MSQNKTTGVILSEIRYIEMRARWGDNDHQNLSCSSHHQCLFSLCRHFWICQQKTSPNLHFRRTGKTRCLGESVCLAIFNLIICVQLNISVRVYVCMCVCVCVNRSVCGRVCAYVSVQYCMYMNCSTQFVLHILYCIVVKLVLSTGHSPLHELSRTSVGAATCVKHDTHSGARGSEGRLPRS